ncbi:WXG100 family type VII secretion target [Nocardia flavorosea]|uniref:ESAT-6-like protein n=1 Tax=Nocardia flavorosea TaxID=53429 RepID=A0A846YAX2_9NOCA|nr:WXG100 family type VII secretion target [Nocardia flavorosea]NKY54952.1 WXG100 family type VII secretion target [Nocardia flavorosea]
MTGSFTNLDTDSIGADQAAVANVATRMNDAIENLRTTFNLINQEVQDVKRGWKGMANTSFENKLVEWDGEAKRLNDKLQLLQEAVNNSGKKIGEGDEANV